MRVESTCSHLLLACMFLFGPTPSRARQRCSEAQGTQCCDSAVICWTRVVPEFVGDPVLRVAVEEATTQGYGFRVANICFLFIERREHHVVLGPTKSHCSSCVWCTHSNHNPLRFVHRSAQASAQTTLCTCQRSRCKKLTPTKSDTKGFAALLETRVSQHCSVRVLRPMSCSTNGSNQKTQKKTGAKKTVDDIPTKSTKHLARCDTHEFKPSAPRTTHRISTDACFISLSRSIWFLPYRTPGLPTRSFNLVPLGVASVQRVDQWRDGLHLLCLTNRCRRGARCDVRDKTSHNDTQEQHAKDNVNTSNTKRKQGVALQQATMALNASRDLLNTTRMIRKAKVLLSSLLTYKDTNEPKTLSAVESITMWKIRVSFKMWLWT